MVIWHFDVTFTPMIQILFLRGQNEIATKLLKTFISDQRVAVNYDMQLIMIGKG